MGSILATPAAYPQAVSSAGYGGFWIRFLAVIIDGILLSIVLWPARVIIFSTIGVHGFPRRPEEWNVTPLFAVIPTLWSLNVGAAWLYEALLTSSPWQGTVGKKVLHLRVTDEAGNRISFLRATGRHFAKFISASILMIGFIMAGFTERKRALHDMIAGTVVRKD